MIQRIQTVFLLLAVIAQILFVSLRLTIFTLANNIPILFKAKGFIYPDGTVAQATIPLIILSFAILLLTFYTIFLFRKRILQIRFCIYSILLNLGMVGLLITYIVQFTKQNEVVNNAYGPAMVIPLANIILLFLAFRGIRKDEVLIKAAERLR